MYGIDLGVEIPVVFTSEDAATALERHFQPAVRLALRRGRSSIGPAPQLTDASRRQLQSGNIDAGPAPRPAASGARSRCAGFMILKAVDVTDQEVLSSLKRDLIDKESIVSNARFESLAGQAPDAVPPARPAPGPGRGRGRPGARAQRRHESRSRVHLRGLGTPQDVRVHGSLYERAVVQGRPVIVDDLAAWPGPHADGERS